MGGIQTLTKKMEVYEIGFPTGIYGFKHEQAGL